LPKNAKKKEKNHYNRKLKDQNLNLLVLCAVPITKLGPSEQLQEWKMSFLHVEDTPLFLVNIRAINDNSFQLIQF
jgi:hypothetical protein